MKLGRNYLRNRAGRFQEGHIAKAKKKKRRTTFLPLKL